MIDEYNGVAPQLEGALPVNTSPSASKVHCPFLDRPPTLSTALALTGHRPFPQPPHSRSHCLQAAARAAAASARLLKVRPSPPHKGLAVCATLLCRHRQRHTESGCGPNWAIEDGGPASIYEPSEYPHAGRVRPAQPLFAMRRRSPCGGEGHGTRVDSSNSGTLTPPFWGSLAQYRSSSALSCALPAAPPQPFQPTRADASTVGALGRQGLDDEYRARGLEPGVRTLADLICETKRPSKGLCAVCFRCLHG